jgi:hypothetical protein
MLGEFLTFQLCIFITFLFKIKTSSWAEFITIYTILFISDTIVFMMLKTLGLPTTVYPR